MQPLNFEKINKIIQDQLKDWKYLNNSLIREYNTDNWLSTMMIANVISYLAESSNHHPELNLSYSKITIKLNTHDVGNKVSEKDIDMAIKIESILVLTKNNFSSH